MLHEEDARYTLHGTYSGWLQKAKRDGAKTKFLGSSVQRFFTIDFDEQTLSYTRGEGDVKASSSIAFSDILGASRPQGNTRKVNQQSLTRSLSAVFTRRPSAMVEFPFILHTCDRRIKLAADTDADACAWIKGLNAAHRIGNGHCDRNARMDGAISLSQQHLAMHARPVSPSSLQSSKSGNSSKATPSTASCSESGSSGGSINVANLSPSWHTEPSSSGLTSPSACSDAEAAPSAGLLTSVSAVPMSQMPKQLSEETDSVGTSAFSGVTSNPCEIAAVQDTSTINAEDAFTIVDEDDAQAPTNTDGAWALPSVASPQPHESSVSIAPIRKMLGLKASDFGFEDGFEDGCGGYDSEPHAASPVVSPVTTPRLLKRVPPVNDECSTVAPTETAAGLSIGEACTEEPSTPPQIQTSFGVRCTPNKTRAPCDDDAGNAGDNDDDGKENERAARIATDLKLLEQVAKSAMPVIRGSTKKRKPRANPQAIAAKESDMDGDEQRARIAADLQLLKGRHVGCKTAAMHQVGAHDIKAENALAGLPLVEIA